MFTSFYTQEELNGIGFKSLGNNVFISRKASIYDAGNISIGNNVRIDDFCVLSGKIVLGDYVHIAVFCALFGGDIGITISDFSTLSSRCSVYAISDDYSGGFLTNPMVPEEYRSTVKKSVMIEKHVIVGTGSTVFPGVTIGTGVAVGSMSLVNKSLDEWGIYVGVPCIRKKDRSRNLLEQERKFREELDKIRGII